MDNFKIVEGHKIWGVWNDVYSSYMVSNNP
jgi:hypothetical protein